MLTKVGCISKFNVEDNALWGKIWNINVLEYL